ncbi:MAG: GLPGLI family protein [Crocinitomix sp.]|nr:GLPGLI family protein [Crocinitomix sp.]
MKIGIILINLLFTGLAFAQNHGEVKYTTKINLHAELPDDENSEMIKQMIPEFQKMNNVLLFTDSESFYTNESDENANETIEEQDGNVQIKIEMDAPEEKIYTDIANGIIVEQRDLMGKMFLIRDTLEPADWRVTDEQQIHSGLVCQKAELITEEDTITAWFTSEIPVSTGPAGFAGLPGLIVHISMNNGNFQITATDIDKREIGKKEIKAPTKGKTITAADFEALERKKMQEMQEQYGGGEGGVIMITN